jgi:hypothetical protein
VRAISSAKKVRTAAQSPVSDHTVVAGQSGQGCMALIPIARGIPAKRMRITNPRMASFFISDVTLADVRRNLGCGARAYMTER